MEKIERFHKSARMSQIVVAGDRVYTAGIVAKDPNTDVEAQTGQILDLIDSYLMEAGSNKNRILSATIWLSTMAHYQDMNSVWDAWVSKDNPPVRACVEAKLAAPEYKVEIQIIALI